MKDPEDKSRQPGESWESYADRQIREAEAAGEFRSLPGFGSPIPGIDEPQDENWWIKSKLKSEQVNALPPLLEARLQRERVLESIHELRFEFQVRRVLNRLNEMIQAAHFSSLPSPPVAVWPVDVEEVVAKWRSDYASADTEPL